MKMLILKSILLLGLLIIFIIGIVLLPILHNRYELAIIDKNELLVNTKSPKLILAGGSNLAFGIDSEQLQQALHIPVVNMGVHVGFGLGRILDDISPYLNSGDILLVIPEYSSFSSDWDGAEAAYNLIFDTGFMKNRRYRLLFSNHYNLPKNFKTYLVTKIKYIFYGNLQLDPRIYTREGFNKHGDYVAHLNFEPAAIIPAAAQISSINRHYINEFTDFIELFGKRNITMLLSYPGYQMESFDNSKDFIHDLDAIFRENGKITVISKPEEYRLPANNFYDTPYHLNAIGRKIRTEKLIKDIKETINPQSGTFATPANESGE